ncbi:hypothetical protein CH63R_05232 [Colletotrichum higginsianum IMI 349063]|uniref:Uncharacterized protein n=2 Tax=Colletotrichum higginsianum TaxID=80884 RepID=A0A1B7YLL9_COLHI|nr:hypothetical protein CH63R_05232 [Colletotrichum higginsianum IMI 349063]OBR12936.1 hypothetical protein CH63R_05232 [Colletotrichum higginsianum IMI 349063]TIC99167.1 hypothetical protein CH35J_004997 [Colletotrichum higginsianum]
MQVPSSRAQACAIPHQPNPDINIRSKGFRALIPVIGEQRGGLSSDVGVLAAVDPVRRRTHDIHTEMVKLTRGHGGHRHRVKSRAAACSDGPPSYGQREACTAIAGGL